MDERRFDAIARKLALASNRRRVLRGLLGIGGIAAATSFDRAEAARRPTPTPRPVRCPGSQTWNGSVCACADGKESCGAECCTPGVSECCDNACCVGSCYGDGRCCPASSIVCNGQCRDWDCCTDDDCPTGSHCHPESHVCQCEPDCTGKTCGDDGCGESCGSCPEQQTCSDGACACITGHLCADGVCHRCCADSDCTGNDVCNLESHICQCTADCTGKVCGDNGCGESCGTCPEGQACTTGGTCACASGALCSDGVCHDCCADADCAASLGGVAECWKCVQDTCGYYSGFCSGGVCGISSQGVIGHCIACGTVGPLGGDSCSSSVPCCTGYTCDFKYSDQGICRQQPA